MKKIISIMLACMVLLGGCGEKIAAPDQQGSEAANSAGEMVIADGSGENDENSSEDSGVMEMEESSAEAEVVISNEEMFTKRDSRTTYEDVQTTIYLNGSYASCDSSSVQIEGSVITITDEGTYIVEGNLDDGMIIVDAEETDKPQIVLNGASINCAASAPICILEADKVFITLEAYTENVLSNGGVFEAIDENNIDAVIFSKQDLTLNGSGSLTVTSPMGHGIVSKDDLVLIGGSYVITSASHGVDANDSVRIAGASMNIAAGKDGIHAENSEDETKGFVYIESGGFVIDSADDAIHSNTSVTIEGGSFEIASGDDGVHANETLTINDCTMNISESYEGLEALDIVINGGDISLVASDDGLNAAGGTDSSGTGGRDGDMFGPGMKGGKGGPGGFGGMSAGNGSIVINGGNLYIEAFGDGIDANGYIEMTGGYVVVCGPTMGDTATLDYDTTATISGGTFIGSGASGMAQTFSDSTQGVIACSVGNQSAGSKVTLTDADGNVLLEYEPLLDYAVFIYSSEEIVKGETYTLTVGTLSGDVDAY